MKPTGRRPGGPDTRAEVLAAARRQFARAGYARATIRSIAGEAGVDPALVHHYFGTKQALFRAAAAFPIEVDGLLASLREGSRSARTRALASFFFAAWEDDGTRLQLLAMLRSAMTHEDAAALLRAFIGRELLGPVSRALGIDAPEVRVPLAAAQMVGVAMLRYVLAVEPLASLPTDELVARVVPVLEHHLFGAAP